MKKNLKNMTKQGVNLKKYLIKMEKVWKLVVNGFFRLEKKNAICQTTKTLINAGKEIAMPNEINLTWKSFSENLFQKDIKNLLLILKLLKLRYKYLMLAMKIMQNEKMILPKIISL